MPSLQTRLIEAVADATQHRDRDQLDLAIARVVVESLGAARVRLARICGGSDDQRVASCAEARADGTLLLPVQGDYDALPRVRDIPTWNECALTGDVVHDYVEDPDGTVRARSVFQARADRELIALLEIEADPAHPTLQEDDIRIVSSILRIFRNHISLLDYGECDTLTGLLNRKTYEKAFFKLRDRAQPATPTDRPHPTWLGVIDIDRFKSINDTYGHLFGDEVLLLVSRLIRENFRGSDQMFRFGGEEFVVVLDRTAVEGARIAFERLRARIEAHVFPQVGRVTVSLGYTEIAPQDLPGSAFDRADAALYYAKNHGRNRVECFDELVSSGRLAPKEERAEIELF